jgi:hypothetical protein
MNSSANQISPVSHRREVISRVPNFFPNRQVLPKHFLENPVRAASGCEYAVNGPGYARRKAGLPARPQESGYAISRIARAQDERLRRTFWVAENFETADRR